jgi:hypothetical protein
MTILINGSVILGRKEATSDLRKMKASPATSLLEPTNRPQLGADAGGQVVDGLASSRPERRGGGKVGGAAQPPVGPAATLGSGDRPRRPRSVGAHAGGEVGEGLGTGDRRGERKETVREIIQTSWVNGRKMTYLPFKK